MIRVCIADDHPIVRHGLRDIIAEETDMRVACEAKNGNEAMAFVHQHKCDIMLLDLSMPDKGGLDVLAQLKYERSKLPVLVLSMYSEDQYAARVLKAGAAGYMNKISAPEELVKAIRQVVAGSKYISPSLANLFAIALERGSKRQPHHQLSDREFSVLCMIAQSKRIKEIAADLCISAKTVSTYRSRILNKMKMKTNMQLMAYALKHKLAQ
jgi:two-component system, NarL family, invasion response regulator UvrY